MASTTFIVPGRESGKARPVVNRVRNKAGEERRVTNSPDPKLFQYNVAAYAQAAGLTPTDRPVAVALKILRQIPHSWSKRKQTEYMGNPAMATPDGVNVEAAVWDALEGVAYHNDRQVARWGGARFWSDVDRVEITVEVL